MIFELSAIDLVGEPLFISTVEQFLGPWNVNQRPTSSAVRHFVYTCLLFQRYTIFLPLRACAYDVGHGTGAPTDIEGLKKKD